MGFEFIKAPVTSTPVTQYWQPASGPPPVTNADITNTNSATGGILGGYLSGGVFSLFLAVQNFLTATYRLASGLTSNLTFSSATTNLQRTQPSGNKGEVEISDTQDAGNIATVITTEDAAGNYTRVISGIQNARMISDQTISTGNVIEAAVLNGELFNVAGNGSDVFAVSGSGEIRTNQINPPAVLVTVAGLVPLRDMSGTLIGYVEVKTL
jgi:hypothetical protein